MQTYRITTHKTALLEGSIFRGFVSASDNGTVFVHDLVVGDWVRDHPMFGALTLFLPITIDDVEEITNEPMGVQDV